MTGKNELWTCPKCGGQFFQKNLWHSCTKYSEEEFLQGKSERAIELYRHFLCCGVQDAIMPGRQDLSIPVRTGSVSEIMEINIEFR